MPVLRKRCEQEEQTGNVWNCCHYVRLLVQSLPEVRRDMDKTLSI